MFPIVGNSRSVPLFLSLSLISISGLVAADPSTSSKTPAKNDSNSSAGLTFLIVCLALVAAVALLVVLYKFWQKKKRAEQHARLLKLFEDDDELEVELGIRD